MVFSFFFSWKSIRSGFGFLRYTATEQRAIERKIRERKRKLVAYDEGIKQSTGAQKGEFQMRYAFEGKRLSELNAELDDFCRQTGLQKQYDRSRVLDFGRSEAQKEVAVERKSVKTIDNPVKHGIIKNKNNTEVHDVRYIGKLDKNIYKCVTDDIRTDEVVITKKQIDHIKERHPNDYERFGKYFGEIISKPDYIIAANKPNTALILKNIKVNGEQFKTILRIITSEDSAELKNSIITFMKIDEKEWKRLLKNKKILYKSE